MVKVEKERELTFQQLSIFDIEKLNYKITKPIRLIELFGGIGSQAKALKNIGANFEHYKVVEWDKYAIASYNAIHGTNFKTSDITKIHASDLEIVDTWKYEYIMTYSFPCQDLSLAGKGKGMEKGSGTRSGLLWEVERILNECDNLPQVLLMENVTQVHSKRNIDDFKMWISSLEELGYSCFWQDLNAKDFGIPQNRNRTFMVSILGDFLYEFPKPIDLELKLKDMLEETVDDKYFLSEKMIEYISATGTANFSNSDSKINLDIARPITTDQNKRAGTTNYLSKDLPLNYDLNNRSSMKIKNATKRGYLEAYEGDGVDISNRMQWHRGTVQKDSCQTLNTQCNVGVVVRKKR